MDDTDLAMQEYEDKIAEWEERAAIMQYDGGMTRRDAERAAWRDIFGEEMPDGDG